MLVEHVGGPHREMSVAMNVQDMPLKCVCKTSDQNMTRMARPPDPLSCLGIPYTLITDTKGLVFSRGPKCHVVYWYRTPCNI